MPAKIITVAQQKGGAGKTTLAVHLSLAFAEQGLKVAAVDIDPQGSMVAWFAHREKANPDLADKIAFHAFSGWRVAGQVESLAKEFDVIVIDSPPHAETEAKVAIRAADLVVIPMQPSALDLWATEPTRSLAEGEGRPHLLVLNRVPPRAKLTEQVSKQARDDGLRIADASIGNRVAFASSLAEGKGITEAAPSSVAAGEMRALAEEIMR